MHKTGRPRKPTALHVLEGTTRPDRTNLSEPQPVLTDDRPPIWLKGRGRRGWKWVAPVVRQMKILTDADKAALALLCDALGDYVECQEALRQGGRWYETLTKLGERMIKPHPAVAMASDAWRRAARMMVEFGMTPSARSRVKAAAEKDVDPFEAFLSGASSVTSG